MRWSNRGSASARCRRRSRSDSSSCLEPGAGLADARAGSPSGPRRRAMSVAYPGLWVRPDVYATHGHYLDCHLTVPTLERLSVGAMSRVLGRPAAAFGRVEDYEAVAAPVFAWRDAVARDARTGAASRTECDRRCLAGARRAPRRRDTERRLSRRRSRRLRRLRALVGRLPARRRGAQPRRARAAAGRHLGRRAAPRGAARRWARWPTRLGLGDAYVVFGHTHRAGPLPGDSECRVARARRCARW